MRKLFTTIIMAILAVATSAQSTQEITFKPFAQGNNPLVYNCDNMFMYLVDNKDKMECDEHPRTFSDGFKFYSRLKTSGKSARGNQIFLSIKAKGTLTIYASSASSDQARTLAVMRGPKTMSETIITGQNKAPIVVEVDKIGEYQIMYPDGPVNIFCIKFAKQAGEAAE